jgi:hypothetical protein
MKKMIFFVVITLAAGAAFAQTPTHEEAARVIEGFWHCVGNGDADGLGRYATGEYMIGFGKLYITKLPEDRKIPLKEYTVTIIAIEENRDGTYNCAYTDNDLFYSGRGLLNCTLVRTGQTLFIAH